MFVRGSKISFCSDGYPVFEDRTSDWLINDVERIDDAFDPCFVDFHHELTHSLLGLNAIGIACQ